MTAKTASNSSPPLLPPPLASGLVRCCGFAAGWALLVTVVLAWTALLSAPITGLGGIVADALLQSLGLASAIVLLAPTLIAWDLAQTARAPRWRRRLMLFAVATMALSGALAAPPGPYGWPMSHGLGGMLGEGVLSLGASLFSPMGSDRADLLAALALLGPGGLATARAVGFDAGRLQGFARKVGSWRNIAGFGGAPWRLRLGGSGRASLRKPAVRIEPGLPFPDREERSASPPSGRRAAAPVDAVEVADGDRDARLAAESRAMARRFAPKSGGTTTPPDSRTEAPRPAPPRPRVRPKEDVVRRAAEAETARRLERALAGLGVSGTVRAATRGPTVTLFEFAPARPPSVSRLNTLATHLARALDSQAARVTLLANDAIGFELANARRDPTPMSDMLEVVAARSRETRLPVAIGKAIGGEAIIADLARMPHLLIAGGPASGKSMGLHAIALSLMRARSPEHCRLLLIDGKSVELSIYDGCPHLIAHVVTRPGTARSALAWLVAEAERRATLMAKLAVATIDSFNARVRAASARGEPLVRAVETGFDAETGQAVVERERFPLEVLPYIVVVIDELAELVQGPGRGIGRTLGQLARVGRDAGIHLVVATQRASADVIPGALKAATPARVAYRATSRVESRLILNDAGAEQLLGAGDLLLSSGAGQSVRLQGPFATREEIAALARRA